MTQEKIRPQDKTVEQPMTDVERDQQIAEKLQSNLENLKSFEPSGDIASDFNNLLELTNRDSLYKKVDQNENPHVILAGLTGIKTAWEQTMRNPSKVDTENEAKRLFFIDVPQAELETINRVINFYLNKYSDEKEKISDDDFEKFKEGAENLKAKNVESALKSDETSLETIENDLELTEEDKELCRQWEKTADELQNMPISGNIAEDFNKFVELTDDDNLFNKVDLNEKSDTVLMNFVKLQTTWENAFSAHEARPAVQKAAMRDFFLNTLKRNIGVAKKFVDYYKTKQSM